MHSSRMRTGRSLTVCRSVLPEGGGVSAPEGVVVCSCGECPLLGGICSGGGGCLLPGGCLLQGGLLWGVVYSGGVSAPGGSALGGVSAPGGVCSWGVWYPSMHQGRHPPCEQNDKQVQKYYLGHNFVAAGN